MTQALWGVLLLSLATGAPGGGSHAGAAMPDVRPAVDPRPAIRVSAGTESRAHAVKAASAAGKTSESYKTQTAK